MQTIESEIISRFSLFLDRNGFTVLRTAVDNEHFGNEVVICSSPRFRLKFVKDRGQIFMEISPGAREPWYPLEDVLKVALGSQEFEAHYAYYMADLTSALELNLEPVTRAVHEKQDEIAALGRDRAQEVAQDIFGRPIVYG
jgi:hypothetical protein